MTIILMLGNVGSGKTIMLVRKIIREMPLQIKTFTNVHMRDEIYNTQILHPDMIVKKEVASTTTNRKGEVKEKYKYAFNIDFWEKQRRPLNIYIDEAGILVKSRRSMSALNVAFQDFMALSRKISTSSTRSGDLVLTAQTLGLIDNTIQALAHKVIYCVCYNTGYCDKCFYCWKESSEDAEKHKACPRCGNIDIKKTNFTVRERRFKALPGSTAVMRFAQWCDTQDDNIPYKDGLVQHAERYFPMYNTFQLRDMFAGYATEKESIIGSKNAIKTKQKKVEEDWDKE